MPDASSQMSKSLEQDLTTFLDSSGREFCDIVLRLGDVPVAAHKVGILRYRPIVPVTHHKVQTRILTIVPAKNYSKGLRDLLKYSGARL